MRKYSIDIFSTVIKDFNIVASLVASNDEHFICLAFETMNRLKASFDMQAFNFVYGVSQNNAKYNVDCMCQVLPEEYESMNSITDSMWDGCFEDSQNQFYAIKDENEILGFGSIIPVKSNKKIVDIGNFVLPQYRRNGVGRSIIINLVKIAKRQGNIPVAGCWYGNKESIATLQSSGFIPESRIFYVKFI